MIDTGEKRALVEGVEGGRASLQLVFFRPGRKKGDAAGCVQGFTEKANLVPPEKVKKEGFAVPGNGTRGKEGTHGNRQKPGKEERPR